MLRMASLWSRQQLSGQLMTCRTMASVAPKTRVELFYEILSPYSWIAFEVLCRYQKHWNMDLQLKPVLLGVIFKTVSGKLSPPSPAKHAYTGIDLMRGRKYFNVPLEPVTTPLELIVGKGSLVPNRFLTAVGLLFPDKLEAVTRAVWMQIWNKDQDITTPEVLVEAAQAAGLTQQQISTIQHHMTETQTKDTLKANTQAAIDFGAFGAPTIVAHIEGKPEMFFGSDRFPVLAMMMGEKWMGPEPDSPHPRL